MSKPRRPDYCEPVCIECGRLGVLTPGREVYPHREDLWARSFYVCACGARVGCHPGTDLALGRPCGRETALARDKAHREFDAIWKRKVDKGERRNKARNDAYKWLAGELRIERETCHISWFDLETCRRVIGICRPVGARIERNRNIEARRIAHED